MVLQVMDRPETLISDDLEHTTSSEIHPETENTTPEIHPERENTTPEIHPETENASESDGASSFFPVVSPPVSDEHRILNEDATIYRLGVDIRPVPVIPTHPIPPKRVPENRHNDESSIYDDTQNPGGLNELQSLIFTHMCPNCSHIFDRQQHVPAKDLLCGHIYCKSCLAVSLLGCPLCIRYEESATGRGQQENAVGGLSEQMFYTFPSSFEHSEATTHLEDNSEQSDVE